MAIYWRLRTYLATKHGIYTVAKFQKTITKATGVIVSVQNLRKYLNKKPKLIPLKTIELFCTALNCELSCFCEVKPILPNKIPNKLTKLSFHNTPLKNRVTKSFPDPNHYE